MPGKTLLAGLIALAAITGTAASAMATPVTLGFGTLPSAQGWTYDATNNYPEASTFTVNGGALHQDLLWQSAYGYAGYILDNTIANAPIYISVTMRSTSEVVQSSSQYHNVAVGFYADFGGFEWGVGIGADTVNAEEAGAPAGNNGFATLSTSVDTSQYQNYLLEASPVNGDFTLLVNGVPIGSGVGLSVSNSLNDMILGDGVGFDHATGDYSAFAYSTTAPTSVPEPPTWGLLPVGLLLLACARSTARRSV